MVIITVHILHDSYSKGCQYPSHFTFEINVGKRRILKLNHSEIEWWISRLTQTRLKIRFFKFRVVLCRIRLVPTLFSKIKWLAYGLPIYNLSYQKQDVFLGNIWPEEVICDILEMGAAGPHVASLLDKANKLSSDRVLVSSNSILLPERALVWTLEQLVKKMTDNQHEDASLGLFRNIWDYEHFLY